MQFVMNLAASLSDLLRELSMYSKRTLIIQIIAKMNDPKARDPALYLTAHLNPVQSEKSPLVSLVDEKYQVHTATIMTKPKRAWINSNIQKNINT